MSIVFVILHYMALKETETCIMHIRENLDTRDYKIIVVDNASPNASGKVLIDKYGSDDDVAVLCNEKNLGFTGGNNVGYRYAKKHFNPEYIVLLNSDAYLTEKNFYEKLCNLAKKERFAVAGPCVRTPDGKTNTNPHRIKPPSQKEIIAEIFVLRIELFFNYLYLGTIYRKIIFWSKKIRGRIWKINKNDETKKTKNVILHGCCLIFSRQYIDCFEGLIEKTFLYGEETILYMQVRKKGMELLYCPEIEIFHKCEASSNAATRNNARKTKINYLQNSIKSHKVLLNILKDERLK